MSAQLALGGDALGAHAWLCAPCAQRFGRDEPPSSWSRGSTSSSRRMPPRSGTRVFR